LIVVAFGGELEGVDEAVDAGADAGRVTQPCIDVEREQLRSPWPRVRMEAVASLAKRRDERTIELLASLLEDQDVDVLYTVASALAHVAAPSAVTALIRLALDERQHVMRRAVAVLALSWLCYPTEDVRAALDWITRRADPWLQAMARATLTEPAR
jgi:hypothetical protein